MSNELGPSSPTPKTIPRHQSRWLLHQVGILTPEQPPKPAWRTWSDVSAGLLTVYQDGNRDMERPNSGTVEPVPTTTARVIKISQ